MVYDRAGCRNHKASRQNHVEGTVPGPDRTTSRGGLHAGRPDGLHAARCSPLLAEREMSDDKPIEDVVEVTKPGREGD
jgi:hypothetical protein